MQKSRLKLVRAQELMHSKLLEVSYKPGSPSSRACASNPSPSGPPYLGNLRRVVERNSPIHGGWREQNPRAEVGLRGNTLGWKRTENPIRHHFPDARRSRASLTVSFGQEMQMW